MTMAKQLTPLTPADVSRRLASKSAVLVDVREADEYARAHIDGAVSAPLSRWEAAPFSASPGRDVIFTCRSGARTQGACERLARGIEGDAYVLDGGIDAWQRAGLPVEIDRTAPLEIMRQVQIAAGSLVLLGILLGMSIAPAFYGIAAFVGAGLVFAGVTGFCGMARLLAVMPWNRRAAS